MKYLLDFLGIQPAENPGEPLPDALTKPTEPPARGRNPAPPPVRAADETDETSPAVTDDTVPGPAGLGPPPPPSTPAAPEAWPGEHAALTQENRRVGYDEIAAASLATQFLRARAACPWRATVATWDIPRRQRWGDRAGELQDSGIGWRDAERLVFEEINCEDEVSAEGPPASNV